ncbi:MAG: leucine-rich repeat protein [Ruminococcus sp.]|nr:leucine-rich repeat protein [Ruminococcus sp.]
MNFRRFIAAVTSICLIGGALPNAYPVQRAAAYWESGTEENFEAVWVGNAYFKVFEDHAEFAGSKASLGEKYEIPAEVKGVPVTHIITCGGNKDMKTIVIPSSVTYIGQYFLENTSVTSVTLPKKLEKLNMAAFEKSNVEEIKIDSESKSFVSDDGVLFSANEAGGKKLLLCYPPCKKDETYKIPEGTSLYLDADKTFGAAKNIKTLVFPDHYAAVINYKSEPTSIKKIVVCDPLAEIVDDAATFNSALTLSGYNDSTISAYAEKYSRTFETLGDYAGEGLLDHLKYEKFNDHIELVSLDTQLRSVNIPAEIEGLPVTKIGECFKNQKLLKTAVIPDTVTDIGDGAFSGCTALTKVTLPAGLKTIGKEAFCYCSALESIELPPQLESIGESAFSTCKLIKSVTIPDTVTVIGDYAFSNCDALSSLTLPNSKASFGKSIAAACPQLKTIKVPENVRNIGRAFEAVPLETIEFSSPETLVNEIEKTTTIRGYNGSDQWAAAKLNGCNFINIGGDYVGTATYYAARGDFEFKVGFEKAIVMKYRGEGETAAVPETVLDTPVKEIAESAFADNKTIKTVKLPNGLKTIGSEAFANAKQLTSVNLPYGLTELGEGAFKNTSIRNISIPASIKEIGAKTFRSCTNLQTVKLGTFTETIGEEAFYGCVALKSVRIPTTVKKIERNAFYFTKALTDFKCLSADCEFTDYKGTAFIGSLEGEDGDSFYLPVNFTGVLYGYDGSTMEKYAADHGLQFKSLGEKPEYELGNPTKFTANDSFITSDDASYILRLYSLAADGATKPTEAEMLSCDVNGDGFITADDASLVLRFYSLASAPDYKKTIVEFLSDVT